MKFSFNWLNEFISINIPPEQLADKLTMSGFEVESLEHIGDILTHITVGKILSIQKHPNADKLVITSISDGTDTHQIVTGAQNIKEGDIVPVSLIGATLSNGLKIKKSKLRGVESNGMLCSQVELGVSDEASGIWILPEDTPLGGDFVKGGFLKDTLLDIDILPNRGDCQSVYGLAREISVILNQPLKPIDIKLKEVSKASQITVSVQNQDLCPLYSGRVIDNITIKPSPLWMQRRLQLMGIQPINNIVDITNYVLLELGQPLHAFDLDCIKGQTITVRPAKKGESITTLDDAKRTLSPNNIIIADGSGPIAIAGVMGAGNGPEISVKSKNILLESAYFDAVSVRRTAFQFSLRTESAIRFEKGVDPEGVISASDRAAQLITELSGGLALKGPIIEKNKQSSLFKSHKITVDYKTITQFLGIEISESVGSKLLQGLGFEVKGSQVTVPSFRRKDVVEWPDIAEEVGRLRGFNHIKSQLPHGQVNLKPTTSLSHIAHQMDHYLRASGFSEIKTFPMVSPELLNTLGIKQNTSLTLQNPLNPEESIMRPSLLPSLLLALMRNLKRQQQMLQLFEIGTCFQNSKNQHTSCACLVTGDYMMGTYMPDDKAQIHWDFQKLKGVLNHLLHSVSVINSGFKQSKLSFLHPKKSLDIFISNETVGHVGFLHPIIMKELGVHSPVGYIELNVDLLVPHIQKFTYEPISKYPQTRRDISIIVPKSFTYEDIVSLIRHEKNSWVQDIFLFDYFENEKMGEDNKSLALGLIYQGSEETLTDDDVNKVHQQLVSVLKKHPKITVR
ncbi:MAG: phenylalanine--tRNA ligase subunit beta [Candidatus Margulisbacteria bacterium]|nr:phenylalanine--tRNA ligase subunit beta [Candidatus Margulisiibacteriota bacterium]